MTTIPVPAPTPASERTPAIVHYLYDLAGAPPAGRRLVAPSHSALAQLRRSMSHPTGIAPEAVPHLVR
ncbi:hypothetical protein, partial [Frankia tisae]|uniref:hypothetical protein n=1 Tax=Frankia tisae TaxID=2950104 RepID=UPI0021BF2AD9